jgi:hypothetical protein
MIGPVLRFLVQEWSGCPGGAGFIGQASFILTLAYNTGEAEYRFCVLFTRLEEKI